MAEPLHVVGGTVAALVCADEAARRGREVVLSIPAGRVGGGFLPIQREGRRLDLGPRIIELGYDAPAGAPPPLEAYRPGPHGHRPYLALIDEFIRTLAGPDLIEIDRPRITRGGRVGIDWVLGGDLVDLPNLLSDEERARVVQETMQILDRLGDAGLLDDPDALRVTTLADASVANHGPAFHEALFGPLVDKALPGGGENVIADLRRKVWMPLLWPRSILEACEGKLTYRPERPMHSVAGGGMGAIVERLRARIEAHPGIVVRGSERASSVEVRDSRPVVVFEDASLAMGDVILATGAEDAFRLAGWAGSLPRVPANFAWVDVPIDDVVLAASVLFVVDPSIPMFRVSTNTGDARSGHVSFVCEVSSVVAGESLGPVALKALEAIGVVRSAKAADVVAVMSGPSLVEPSFRALAQYREGLAVLDAARLPVDVVGAGEFGADSFNEQVVQGLAAARRWS